MKAEWLKRKRTMAGNNTPINHQEFQALVEDMRDMKNLMSKMVDAISRIGLLDERQNVIATSLQKLDERTGRMEAKQQQAEIHSAVTQISHDRLGVLDAAVRELHVERERDKARIQTIVWMIRGLWAFAAAGGLAFATKFAGH